MAPWYPLSRPMPIFVARLEFCYFLPGSPRELSLPAYSSFKTRFHLPVIAKFKHACQTVQFQLTLENVSLPNGNVFDKQRQELIWPRTHRRNGAKMASSTMVQRLVCVK